MNMMSTILFSVFIILVLLSLVVSVLNFYTRLSFEPPILPPYTSIYVKNVVNDTVKIVNEYGYPIRALLVIAYNIGNTTEYSSRIITLRSGLNEINFTRLLGKQNVTIDINNTYMILGDTIFKMTPGSGLVPADSSRGIYTTYRSLGIGLHVIRGYDIFGSLSFNDTLTFINEDFNVSMGYYRNISNPFIRTVIVDYEYGERCNCTLKTYYGEYNESKLNNTCYDECFNRCIIDCQLAGGTDCNNYCQNYCTNECTYYECEGTSCSHIDCSKIQYLYKEKENYTCVESTIGLWMVSTSLWDNFKLRIPVLQGTSLDNTILYLTRTGEQIAFTSKDWEYSVPVSNCLYNYTEVQWYASTYTGSFYACDVDCGYLAYYTQCIESNQTIITDTRNACTGYVCTDNDKFLFIKIVNTTLNMSSPQYVSGKVVFNVTLSFNASYYKLQDKNDISNNILLHVNLTLKIHLPRVVGEVTIPYNARLSSIYVPLTVSVKDLEMTISSYSTGRQVTVVPSTKKTISFYNIVWRQKAFVTGSSKTLEYYSSNNGVLTISVYNKNPLIFTKLDNDNFSGTIRFSIIIIPELVIGVVE